jgi:diacylglycerol kinase
MPRPWPEKFRSAFRGLRLAIRTERSFAVHVPMAIAVAVGAAVLRVTLVEGCILALCVTQVIAAEVFNTALEYLSREVAREPNERLADALDMASGAVLASAIGAAVIGCAVFTWRATIVMAITASRSG